MGTPEGVQIEGMCFVSRSVARAEEVSTFLRDGLGLQQITSRGEVPAVFALRDGGLLAIHDVGEEPESTIVGFLVDDLEDARALLEGRAGVELLGDVFSSESYRWQHFRAPGGHVWEILERRSRSN